MDRHASVDLQLWVSCDDLLGRRSLGGGRHGCQHSFLAVDEGVGIVSGDLKIVAVGNGIARAGFNAITAEDAAVVIDVINFGIALGSANAFFAGILCRLNVNAICRAGCSAEEAGDALLQAVFIALQNVDSAVPGFKMRGLVGIILRHRGFKHDLKRGGESLRQRHGGIGYFPNNVRHNPSRWSRMLLGMGQALLTQAQYTGWYGDGQILT
jgi:hypothetical protein